MNPGQRILKRSPGLENLNCRPVKSLDWPM